MVPRSDDRLNGQKVHNGTDDTCLTRAQALKGAMVGLIDDHAFVDPASGKTGDGLIHA